MSDYVTIAEAAELVGRDKGQVYAATIDNSLPYILRDGVKVVSAKLAKERWAKPKRVFFKRPSMVKPRKSASTAPSVDLSFKRDTVPSPATPLYRLDKALSDRFGRYAPPLTKALELAVDLVIADLEGRVTITEQKAA